MTVEHKLPKLHEDGGFSVVATYLTDSRQALSRDSLVSWLERWVEQNNPWVREWSSGKTETLDFYDDFSEPPRLVEMNQDRIVIRFEGRPGFKWWKDWFVLRFCKQLIEEFPGITELESCMNADGVA